MIEVLLIPFVACLVLTGIHCYLGIHVVMRGVIFVDLALAQIAAMGAAVATAFGYPVESLTTYGISLGFAVGGAAVFSIARFRDQRVPQEAIIGIVYACASAIAIIILSKSAVERAEIEHMLVGRLLFLEWHEVLRTAAIYVAVGAIHFVFRDRFFAITRSAHQARSAGLNVVGWDFLFYLTFALVVTSSVNIAGVLLVFSFLVAPAVAAMIFFRSVPARLIAGWSAGMFATVLGLTASMTWDLPPGVAVVAALGLTALASAIVFALLPKTAPATAQARIGSN
jgi:zinc/manganese transport system permease protein